MKGFLALFDVLPGWVWAMLMAGALATNCTTGVRLDAEKLAHAKTKLDYKILQLAVEKQKTDAANTLAAETARVLDTERKLNEAVQKQEQTDAKNAALVRDLRTRSVGLRDPFAGRGDGGGCPQGQTTPTPSPGAADQPQATGVLSAGFAGLLWDQAAAADEINIAFASCKAHLAELRAKWPE